MKIASPEAYQLMHDGALALSEVEANGMKVDLEYMGLAIDKIDKRVKKIAKELKGDELWKTWKKRHGDKAKLSAREQLDEDTAKRTNKGRISTDKDAFESIDHPFVRRFQEAEAWKHVRNVFKGLQVECDPWGFVHTSFNLNIPTTYRSSSDKPNLQNVPIRHPLYSKWIRKAFIPRGRRRCIVEVDFSGIEVRVSACYNRDPNLIRYIKDPTTDMHRDCAAEVYICEHEEVSKLMRYCAKNMFVFPEFYGSYFMQCAPNLWDAISKMDLNINGVDLRKHLKRQGIKELGEKVSDWSTGRIITKSGTFIDHVRLVEEKFWNERFMVYKEWKNTTFQQFLEVGYIKTLTGFVISSVMNKKEVSNYPIQGSAFHCLLWALIRIIRRIRKIKLDAKVICQIHDSVIADVHEDDVERYVIEARKIMVEELPEEWRWIIVPLEVEAEVAPVGESWYEKKTYHLAA
jgi:DNA polymerase-1